MIGGRYFLQFSIMYQYQHHAVGMFFIYRDWETGQNQGKTHAQVFVFFVLFLVCFALQIFSGATWGFPCPSVGPQCPCWQWWSDLERHDWEERSPLSESEWCFVFGLLS